VLGIRVTKRHLRYLRIIFSSGKLCVKEDEASSQMRSFLLRDLVSVTSEFLAEHHDLKTCGEDIQSYPQLLPKAEIRKRFPLNEKSEFSDWRYTFCVEFRQRTLTFGARTHIEHDEWIRLFRLVCQMNSVGVALSDKNPYDFEAM